ncbi:MAG: AAA family ATPase, partial [Cytophagales bacterium]|nr:AAA family ATPase [Cytophagales bacterium]
MFITHLQLTNFKRFTDLTIDLTSLAQPPKLVLLIGSNGSGKSSVFDGFELLGGALKPRQLRPPIPYQKKRNFYQKTLGLDFVIKMQLSDGSDFLSWNGHIGASPGNDKFYGRSSLRQVPKLTRRALGEASRTSTETDSDRPMRFIERDERFENDVERITQQILREVFLTNNQTSEIKERYINPINEAFKRVFGVNEATTLRLIAFNPPLEGRVAEILFQKGSTEIHYDFLSSGEKEVFNLLINLLSRRGLYQDTVYFFDEIDLHLNTRLQYNLLKEITEHWIPDGC